MTVTKRTDELQPGDVVLLFASPPRTIASIRPTEFKDLVRVRYEPIASASAYGGVAEAHAEWQVVEPSKLDLAVRRAQELADRYADDPSLDGDIDGLARDLGDLLALFRAAR